MIARDWLAVNRIAATSSSGKGVADATRHRSGCLLLIIGVVMSQCDKFICCFRRYGVVWYYYLKVLGTKYAIVDADRLRIFLNVPNARLSCDLDYTFESRQLLRIDEA